MKADPRTMFYIRNKLLVRGILTKQLHILRSNNTMCRTYLLQLAKFHTTIKSNVILKQERLINALSAQPERRLVYSDLRDTLGMEALPFKKMTAAMHANGVIEFQQVFQNKLFFNKKQLQICVNFRMYHIELCTRKLNHLST
jgi:B-block binding subunit of TFIIIC